jgi:hypothetical protein
MKCPYCDRDIQVTINLPSISPVQKQLEEAKRLTDSLPDSETKKKLQNNISSAIANLGGQGMITFSRI